MDQSPPPRHPNSQLTPVFPQNVLQCQQCNSFAHQDHFDNQVKFDYQHHWNSNQLMEPMPDISASYDSMPLQNTYLENQSHNALRYGSPGPHGLTISQSPSQSSLILMPQGYPTAFEQQPSYTMPPTLTPLDAPKKGQGRKTKAKLVPEANHCILDESKDLEVH